MAEVMIGTLAEVPQGQSKTFVKHGKKLLVSNVGGTLVAYENVCPHMGGALRQGGGSKEYTCSWHGATFDVATGCAVNHVAEGTRLKRVEVRTDAEGKLWWTPSVERSMWADDF